jgi:hypothetical protein
MPIDARASARPTDGGAAAGADLVLKREAARWLNPLTGALPSRPCYRGVDDDAGMRDCLVELAALWADRRSP